MPSTALLSFLQQHPMISAGLAHEIAAQFHEQHFARGDFLVEEGKHANHYYFLEEGFARGYARDTEGEEVTTAFYLPGQIILEVSSFFTRTRSLENIQALTPLHTWALHFDELNALFHNLPAFRELGRSILVKEYAALKTRMLLAITETAEQRYARLMQDQSAIFQHAPLKMIASYLGITDSSLSRIRREWTR